METSVRHQLVWFTYGWTDTNRFHNRTNGHKPSSQIPSQIHRNPEGLEALEALPGVPVQVPCTFLLLKTIGHDQIIKNRSQDFQIGSDELWESRFHTITSLIDSSKYIERPCRWI